jgi:TusA-related sulfurtransferase
MSLIQKFILFALVCLGILVSCSSEKECSADSSLKKSGKYNLRKDSELTTLMREMELDFKKIKEDLAAGKSAKPGLDYAEILEAHSTDPEVAESESYRAFAQNFLQVLDAFEKNEVEKSAEIFETLVTSCMNCHQVHCPGPMVRIKKLYQ